MIGNYMMKYKKSKFLDTYYKSKRTYQLVKNLQKYAVVWFKSFTLLEFCSKL